MVRSSISYVMVLCLLTLGQHYTQAQRDDNFQRLDSRLDMLAERLNEFDEKLYQILYLSDNIDGRLSRFDDKLNQTLYRLDMNAEKISEFDNNFHRIDNRLSRFDDKFNQTLKKLSEFDNYFHQILSLSDRIDSRLINFDDKFNQTLNRLDMNAEKLSEFDNKFDQIHSLSDTIDDRLSEFGYKFYQIKDMQENLLIEVRDTSRNISNGFEHLKNKMDSFNQNNIPTNLAEVQTDFKCITAEKHLDELTTQELWYHILLQFDRPFEDRRTTLRGDNNHTYYLDDDPVPPERLSGSESQLGSRIIIPHMGLSLLRGIDKLMNYPQGKNVCPSPFDADTKEAYSALYGIYSQNPGAKGILKVAVNYKDYVNEYIHIQTLIRVIAYERDLNGYAVPPMYDVFPGLFGEDCTAPGDECCEIAEYPTDLTGNEWKLSYFREDADFNNFHGSWHLYNPHDGDKDIPKSHGELFYYFHNQLLARYDMERLSNGLDSVKPLDNWSSSYLIPENYMPPILKNTLARCPNNPTEILLQQLGDYRHILEHDISNDYLILTNGSQVKYNLNDEGTGYVGCALEAAPCGGINHSIYEKHGIHNIGHMIISEMGCPDNVTTGKHGNNPHGVMYYTWSAVRDPIFFRWHKFIDGVFQSHKKRLPEYRLSKLLMKNVSILDIGVYSEVEKGKEGELYTFNSKRKLTLWTNETKSSCLIQPHINHHPFIYNITVNNKAEKSEVIVRIYLVPEQYSSSYTEQREHWALMDRFKYTLKQGNEEIIRFSCDSSITIPPPKSLKELQNIYSKATKPSKCQCGLPQHLLIPRGHPEGMPYQLFVYITPYDSTRPWQPSDCDNVECSDLCSKDYTRCLSSDKEVMGFPFDRPLTSLDGTPINNIKDLEGMLANAKLHDIKIFYNKTKLINERQCTPLVDLSSSSSVKFMIKHKFYNMFLGVGFTLPNHIALPTSYLYPVETAISDPDAFTWTIDPQEGLRGYIRNKKTLGILHPYVLNCLWYNPSGGCYFTGGTIIATPYAGNYKSYFILDQVSNHIVDYEGKNLQPLFYTKPTEGDKPVDSYILCVEPDHYGAEYKEFIFVNPNNPTQEVLPYGKPDINVDWKLLISFINTTADTTWTEQVKVGKSTTASTTNTNEFAWEVSASAKYWFIEVSGSVSEKNEIQQSQAESWNQEITITQTITVIKGVTLVRWQRVFAGIQHNHIAQFNSLVYADTDSIHVKPNVNTPSYIMIL